MAVRQVPIVLWCSEPESQRGWTVVCVQNPELVTFAQDRKTAREEMRQTLICMQESAGFEPDLELPEMLYVKVPARAEYRVGKTVFPVTHATDFRMPCVVAKTSYGLRSCSLPTLGLTFGFDEQETVKELAVHYAQTVLSGQTPRSLMRLLPPDLIELDSVALKTSRREPKEAQVGRPNLCQISESLARTNLRCYGRDAVIAEVAVRINEGASLLLVGNSAIGKTAILAEAARKLDRLPERKGKTSRFWLSSAGRIVAGMNYLGDWQERLQTVIAELNEFQGVLAIENLLEMVRQGGQGPSSSLAAFLQPYLEQGDLQLVTEATPAELVACQQLLPNLVDLFQIVQLEPFSQGQAIEVLDILLEATGKRKRWQFYAGAATDLYRVFGRFVPYSAFPGNVAIFLRQLKPATGGPFQWDRLELLKAFSRYTGIPERFLRDEILLDLEELTFELEEQVVGQPAACAAACRILTTFKAGLQDPTRPLGILLLCGPTGVGKTELAKTLARTLFGQEDRLIRLDMSEYGAPDAPERLLGSLSDGQPSELVRRLRRQPFSVVLLDEVEKAHPEVFDVLLRAFDEGIMHDPWGRETNLRSALILMTSNLGAEQTKDLGFTRHPDPSFEAAAFRYFRPEFLNRIDAIVSFGSLTRDSIERIAAREVRSLEQRAGLRRRSIQLEVTPALVAHLVDEGYDQRLGARPLQRAIERLVVRPLAAHVGEHANARGERWRLDWEAGSLRIKRVAAKTVRKRADPKA